ncbi:MAG TPA: hypothetical protein VLH77_05130, partial [Gammaproteobacteria bacterium]|nr:hypothetical protein [Gammaproteobacteria bacterium]
GEYRFKQLPRGYNRNKLPPVRYSNHAKYWVDYHYQPNAQGLYERDGNTYSRKDLWKIFYFLYCQKSKNKKELSILAQISPSNANEKDEEIIAENKAFNAALEKVRNLKLVEEKPEEQKPVEARKMSKWHRFLQALSMGSSEKKPQEEQKPVEAGDTRKWYKLQVGAFFYSLEGSDAKETLEEMRSPTFIITKGAELKA